MKQILIVEDDLAIINLLSLALKQEGYNVIKVRTAREAIDYMVKNIVDLMILDLGLPDMDGKNVISSVRQYNEKMPILVVSARDNENEKIKCLDLGVNDYIQKPFSSAELMARVRAALRYSIVSENTQSAIFENGNLKIDFSAHSVYINEVEIHLTNFEYKLLVVLAQNVGKTLTHNFIISKVWGVGGNDSNGLRVFMASLRRKIEKNIYDQELIRTEVGIGYRMNRL